MDLNTAINWTTESGLKLLLINTKNSSTPIILIAEEISLPERSTVMSVEYCRATGMNLSDFFNKTHSTVDKVRFLTNLHQEIQSTPKQRLSFSPNCEWFFFSS